MHILLVDRDHKKAAVAVELVLQQFGAENEVPVVAIQEELKSLGKTDVPKRKEATTHRLDAVLRLRGLHPDVEELAVPPLMRVEAVFDWHLLSHARSVVCVNHIVHTGRTDLAACDTRMVIRLNQVERCSLMGTDYSL